MWLSLTTLIENIMVGLDSSRFRKVFGEVFFKPVSFRGLIPISLLRNATCTGPWSFSHSMWMESKVYVRNLTCLDVNAVVVRICSEASSRSVFFSSLPSIAQTQVKSKSRGRPYVSNACALSQLLMHNRLHC